MDSSFKNVSALWLEYNKLFWKESTYTKYLFISKNMDKIIFLMITARRNSHNSSYH